MKANVTVNNSTESRSYDAIKDGSLVGTIVYEQVGGQSVRTWTRSFSTSGNCHQ
jgi:hypothetical protein